MKPVRARVLVREVQPQKVVGIAVAVGMGDEPAGFEVGKGQRPVRGIRGQDEAQLLPAEMVSLKPRMVGVRRQHAKVETPVEQPCTDIGLRSRLEMKAQAGRRAHPGQQARVKQHREAARAGDVHRPRIPVICRNGVAQLRLLAAARQAELKDGFARWSEGKALALARDQALPDLAFELPEMLADAWLGHVQTRCGLGEVSRFAKRREGFEPAGVEHLI